ncbi:MAG: right-handed parallel beta-helix repeat-containing protein, partial [Acidobacteria bacterium]|nr:right-handed parallel beta-helix repeat-containing protein [Acidobacteriota bacterium]
AGGSKVVRLPAATIEIGHEVAVSREVEIDGGGARLHAAPGFRGRALLLVQSAARIRMRDFSIDGNRAAIEKSAGLPPSNVPFARFTAGNGILIENSSEVEIAKVAFSEIAGFAILVNASRVVRIEGVRVENSGSRNAAGRNNATGGILIEEGSSLFDIRGCALRNILGNGIWTHSLYTSPRNSKGRISGSRFEEIGRDAIQIGHATEVEVVDNAGRRIGFPTDAVDIEAQAVPVALDTSGNTDRCVYARNKFEDVNGKCIDLDGFHHGEVRGNSCVNRQPVEAYPFGGVGIVFNHFNPDMESEGIVVEGNEIDGPNFGGIFVIGSGHRITGNKLRNLNRAHCNEEAARFGCYYPPEQPDMLRSGIYLGRGTVRPAPVKGARIERNEISGFKMAERCILAAPGVSIGDNLITGNRCESSPPPPPGTHPAPTPR